ncbi:MAG: ribosome maturation factor RimM [Alphaproteobacteria bacterium]|nr:ribosome maturation factor RimM [Alphaproteobacteria bacterium]
MKRICIGKISGAHGVKGLVKILPYCEDTELLNGKLFTNENGNESLDITLKNNSGKYILAAISGITSREDAEKLKCSLYVPRETLPEIDNDDEFYTQDIVNLVVQDSRTGSAIGEVTAVENYGAGDLLDIKLNNGDSFLLPFRDENIPEVNLDDGYIKIKDYEDFLF